MVSGGPCVLDFSFSPEVEWALTSHQRVLVVLHASPFHKRRFLRVASRKGEEGEKGLRIAVKNAALEREVEELKGEVTRLDGEFGVLLARVEALEVGGGGEVEPLDSDEAAELGLRPDFQDLVVQPDPVDTMSKEGYKRSAMTPASSGYVSAAGEEVVVEEGVGERVAEEEIEMDEEGLWSPSSSDRAVLALIPDSSAFPTQ
ncbi:hypothetical protein BDM02DRAFT_3133202 [Thelephora ganbajun]|uniref:Uncharacterized protein n=1 Tax=Thelephora ganbajun TaxID=370292 RepID=A0ACB6YY83_THEGA|nr:hypothetical protein BDM02DRAFT_3133202 [Thelephora ganbajun]